MTDYHHPTKIWINEVRPAGIAVYGEKQWADWEFLIQTMTIYFGRDHPSRLNPGHYTWEVPFQFTLSFQMNEIDWTIISKYEEYPRLLYLLNRRLAVYMVLMI